MLVLVVCTALAVLHPSLSEAPLSAIQRVIKTNLTNDADTINPRLSEILKVAQNGSDAKPVDPAKHQKENHVSLDKSAEATDRLANFSKVINIDHSWVDHSSLSKKNRTNLNDADESTTYADIPKMLINESSSEPPRINKPLSDLDQVNSTSLNKAQSPETLTLSDSDAAAAKRYLLELNKSERKLDDAMYTRLSALLGNDSSAPVDVGGKDYTYAREAPGKGTQLGIVEESPAYASSVVLASDLLSLSSAVAGVEDRACREQGYRFLDGLLNNKRWALRMFDASAKSPEGLLFGSSFHLGNFDECVAVEEQGVTPRLTGKYCLATILWPQTISHEEKQRRTGRGGELRWAVCVPNACGAAAVARFVGDVVARTVGNTTSVVVSERDCYTPSPITVDKLDITFVVLIIFITVAVVMCTAYELLSKRNDKRNSNIHDAIISFSVVNNMRKILSTEHNSSLGLDCVAGIKALAMIFITAGHACLFIASGPVMDADAWDRLVRHPANAFMLNSTLLVDTFLMLSAFLFCRLLLIELDKRRGRLNVLPIFIFRYIRVTPAYLVVILFYMTWMPRMGTGPLWDDKLQLERQRCRQSWWANLLYINNYAETDSLCMFQSWYLSVDTQLFFLAPVFIFPLWHWRRVGPAILAVGTAASALIPAIITYTQALDPTLLIYAREFKDISQNHYFKEAYMKTHMKATPYFIGLLTGYILHRVQLNKYQFSCTFKAFAWTLSVIFGASVTFSVSLFYQEWYSDSPLSAMAYAGLHKLGWCLANGWLVIACATGNGGFLGKLLTWNFLVPISRVTFCAYLVNGIVELYYVGTLRHPLHISFFNVMANAIAHIILTFILALLLCITFESPIHGIEKILLRCFARPPTSDDANQDEAVEASSRSTSHSKLDT